MSLCAGTRGSNHFQRWSTVENGVNMALLQLDERPTGLNDAHPFRLDWIRTLCQYVLLMHKFGPIGRARF